MLRSDVTFRGKSHPLWWSLIAADYGYVRRLASSTLMDGRNGQIPLVNLVTLWIAMFRNVAYRVKNRGKAFEF